MRIVSTLIVLGAAAIGCANPAVTEVAPGPPIANSASGTAGKAATPPTAATGAAATGMTMTTGSTGTGTTGTTGAAASASTGTAGAPAMTATGGAPASTGTAGKPASTGTGGMTASAAGTTASAGSSAMAGSGGAAGSGTMDALAPCPTDKGWTCQDPSKPLMDMGITNATVTDADGKSIAYACGNGGAVTCDMSNPKSSCPDLPDPFCAHVSIPDLGVDLYSCAQLCKP